MASVQERFLVLASRMLDEIIRAPAFADWVSIERLSHGVEAARLELGLPDELAKSPAALIVTVQREQTPPFCDDNLSDMLQRFTKADITWHAMISSDPVAEPGAFIVTPLWRNADDTMVPLTPFEQARDKAAHSLRKWIEFLERSRE